MSRLRVAIVADLLQEGWPSMDLVTEMLMAELGRHGSRVDPLLLRPEFAPRVTPLLHRRNGHAPLTIDRIMHRFWDYPRWLRGDTGADVFHIVDHSYAHLALGLPADRVVVTCHDTDAFRTLMAPEQRESSLPRPLVRRVLQGLQRASVVACDSVATRDDLECHGLVAADRLTLAPIGVHPSCSPLPDSAADTRAGELMGRPRGPVLLHVGSTIPRKRIDTVLEVFSRVLAQRPDVTLIRVGGPFARDQRLLADSLGISARIRVLPFVERPVLAALYRAAALVVLPSEREGFGLPIVEALACGTPMVASDLPVLREVGGEAAEYCAVGDVTQWTSRVSGLLEERATAPGRWSARRDRGIARAAMFSWSGYADAMQTIYARVAGDGAPA